MRARRSTGTWLVAWATILSVGVAFGQLRGFGTPDGKLPVRGFGPPTAEEEIKRRFPQLAATVTDRDRAAAERYMRTRDLDRDGVLTRDEIRAAGDMKWFAANDLNGDKRIPLAELILRYAQYHQAGAKQREREQRRRKWLDRPPSTAPLSQPRRREDPLVRSRRQQVGNLTSYLTRLHDLNGSGAIELGELPTNSPFGDFRDADSDGDGTVRRVELFAWLQSHLSRLAPSQLAIELQSLDADRDGQVSLREFDPKTTKASLAEFRRWDRNADGFITALESRRPPDARPTRFVQGQAAILAPDATILSSLWIQRELTIEHLSVYVSLSKETDNFTELRLIAPDGRQVILFEGQGRRPWGGGLILKGVTFDDDAPLIKRPLRSPPNPRRLRPPGVVRKDLLSLRDLSGGKSRGRWFLVVRNQNNHPGLLLRWSLSITRSTQPITAPTPSAGGKRK